MLFNSLEYLFIFLPASFAIYHILNRLRRFSLSIAGLVLASLAFYAYWRPANLLVILFSLLVNFYLGAAIMNRTDQGSRKRMLWLGILFNLILLFYYKYTNFFIEIINSALDSHLGALDIVLPLGISFFAFTQIAFLADCHNKKASEYSLSYYSLFVTYFPHLLAGPIIHHAEMIPQFKNSKTKSIDIHNIALGLFLLSIGLFKKTFIADNFAIWANHGFASQGKMDFITSWVTSLSYTLQLYFDFSGYTDMAIGSSYLFNIRLPYNFNSPYKAKNIQEFWRRWHMTLSRFLRDYLYIPLGGNRKSHARTYMNLFVTFLLGGIWHGAGWTFIAWGALHGFGTAVHRAWTRHAKPLPPVLAWIITFNFINVAWVFFRANSIESALNILRGMFLLGPISIPEAYLNKLPWLAKYGVSVAPLTFGQDTLKIPLLFLFTFLLAAFFCPNSNSLAASFKPTPARALFTAVLVSLSLLSIMTGAASTEFIYFNF